MTVYRIYKLTDVTNGIIGYVGVTKRKLKQRLTGHTGTGSAMVLKPYPALSSFIDSSHFWISFCRAMSYEIEIEPLEYIESDSPPFWAEAFHIRQYDTLSNKKDNPVGLKGFRHCPYCDGVFAKSNLEANKINELKPELATLVRAVQEYRLAFQDLLFGRRHIMPNYADWINAILIASEPYRDEINMDVLELEALYYAEQIKENEYLIATLRYQTDRLIRKLRLHPLR